MSATYLSAHARRQLDDRTSLTEPAFIRLIDGGAGVPIGKETGTDKMHVLFYCTLEKLWFIAVIDEKVHEVITILPPDYHNRWRVSPEAMLIAEKNARACEPPVPTIQPKPSRIIFECTVSNGSRTWIKTFGFGLPYDEYSDCVEDISRCQRHERIDAVITQAVNKKYASGVICRSVRIRFNRNGPEYQYPYELALL